MYNSNIVSALPVTGAGVAAATTNDPLQMVIMAVGAITFLMLVRAARRMMPVRDGGAIR